MPAYELLQCRVCLVRKKRIRHTERKNRRGWYYMDGKGRLWDGRQCPRCKSASVARLQKVKRSLPQKNPTEEMIPLADVYTRKCRACKGKTVNYFYCPACLIRQTAGMIFLNSMGWFMGLFSRAKGSREERALVAHLKDLGYTNVRRGLCQEQTKGFRPDVLGELDGKEWSFELKAYFDRFKWLYEFIGSVGTGEDGVLRFSQQVGGPVGSIAMGYDPREVNKMGFERPFPLWPLAERTKEVKRILKLQDLKKEADFLVVKINNKKRLFIRYWGC